MRYMFIIVLFGSIFACGSLCGKPEIPYSGDTVWNEARGVLFFRTSGRLPDSKEGFYWSVPRSVSKIEIGEGVTLTGGFRIGYRKPDNPLYISGKDRESSVIFGTAEQQWSDRNKISDNSKWKYGAIAVMADATVYVSSLTSLNPRSYHISGYAKESVIHVDNCILLDTRGGDNNNSDGFIGSAGSSIRNSRISTLDDSIKAYHDMHIENVAIEQHRNGAAVQFGWGGENHDARVSISNLVITGVNPEGRYNMAPFTWEGGSSGSRNVSVSGLKIRLSGRVYNEQASKWEAAGLFELKPGGCTFNFNASGVDLGGIGPGRRLTRGKVVFSDEETQKNE